MPLYEFVCRDCSREFEQIMSFSAHGHPPCPACGSQHVNRKIGRPAIHFKGSGWYVTDSKGSKQSANGDSEGKAGEGKAGESKSADAKGDSTSGAAQTAAPGGGEGKAAESKAGEGKSSGSNESKGTGAPAAASA